MANTYSQVYIQVVFAVKYREGVLASAWRDEVFRYISGIIENEGQKSIIVGGYIDHVHAFIGLKPTKSISDLVRVIKANSSKFINAKGYLKGRFEWQSGYGVFSYGQSQIEAVYHYIKKQEQHHSKQSFKEEYMKLLEKFEVEFDQEYLFNWDLE